MRNFMQRMSDGFQRFMTGRYGSDQFGLAISILFVALALVSLFLRFWPLQILVWALLIYLWFRMLSRNYTARARENEKFLAMTSGIARFFRIRRSRFDDRKTYTHFRCPGCGQELRAPRGKGRIRVNCPKCHRQFETKA